jgi:copper chaperone CopZ
MDPGDDRCPTMLFLQKNMKMKTQKTRLIILLFFFLPFLVNAQFEKAEFQASGLTCSMCSNAINKALKTVPFIESINVDLNNNLFQINFVKGIPVNIDLIKKKVEDAGFSIAKFWVVVDLHNVKLKNELHSNINGANFHFMNVKDQVLNGRQRLQIIDKNYLPNKEFKKFSAYTSMPCYQTGAMSNCCKSHNESMASSERIYHVTI